MTAEAATETARSRELRRLAPTKITKPMLEHPERHSIEVRVKGADGVERIERKPLVPATGHTVVWDADMRPFGVRVNPAGRIAFLVRYWAAGRSTEQWETLGRFPSLSLTAARKQAAERLVRVAAGGDPAEERRAAERQRRAAEASTVAGVAAAWLAALPRHLTRKGKPLSPRSVEMYTTAVRKYIVPVLGSFPVADLGRAHVRKLLDIATANGGTYAANRAVNSLSSMLTWAQSEELVPAGFNPTARLPRHVETPRGEHAAVRLSPTQEGALITAIYDDMRRDPIGATAVLVLLDSGRRRNEVLALRWDRIDFETGQANLGATKGKTTDSCYLGARSREAIRQLPRIVGNPWVFTGDTPSGRRAGLQSVWERIRKAAGVDHLNDELGAMRLHDLRHHRISEWLAAGVSPALIIRQCGHTSFAQLRTYGHLEALDAARVIAALPLVQPTPPATVLTMPTAAAM